MLGVMAPGAHLVDSAKLGRGHSQLLLLQTSDDFANETALDAVWLHNDQCSIHEQAI
jgi:hypothetical protein